MVSQLVTHGYLRLIIGISIDGKLNIVKFNHKKNHTVKLDGGCLEMDEHWCMGMRHK